MTKAANEPPVLRTRLALALVSLVAIALELTLMRGLALRFWSHFAGMVISVGLLGFAAAGTGLTLLRKRVLLDRQLWMCVLAIGLSAAIPAAWWASQVIPLDVGFLAWSLSQAGNVLAMELAMVVPFLFAGAFVGVALMGDARQIGGHYAANLMGSGAGSLLAVLAMHVLSTSGLLAALTAAAFLSGLLLMRWRTVQGAVAVLLAGATIALVVAQMPWEPAVSPYKMLAQARTWKGTEEMYQSEGPLGRIDVLRGPAMHYAPGLSLQYLDPLPPQTLLITDGDGTSPIYNVKRREEWKFLDYRTAAAPFCLNGAAGVAGAGGKPSVCIVGAGGGAEIGLAEFHEGRRIVALEMNPQVIAAMDGPLAALGGSVYRDPGVEVLCREARGFFADAAGEKFDIIQLPVVDGFGAAGSGLYASQESYLYTVESLQGMMRRLAPGGVLCMTRWVRTPPREELRAFDMAVQALRTMTGRTAEERDPATHIVMLRSWVTASILIFDRAISEADVAALRSFCKSRAFDPCYLPGLAEKESNVYHIVATSDYFDGPRALAGTADARESFIGHYPFDITAPTDDRPYFFHSFRWQSLGKLQQELGAGSHAFLELGYLMLIATLAQTLLLGILLVFAPLVPGARSLARVRGKGSCLLYFLLLGLGFMLLEMGFVQKLVLYLAHPIYAAAVVIAAFLLFAGLGSALESRWKAPARTVVGIAAGLVVIFGVAYLAGLDAWLGLTISWPLAGRCAVAILTIAPLATAMGHLFPAGLKRLGESGPELIPWSLAVNGVASVAASAAAPLLAMEIGFSRLTLLAVGCYGLAIAAFFVMNRATQPMDEPPLAKSLAGAGSPISAGR